MQVFKKAQLQALRMIALERTLQDRKLLDTIAAPTRLTLVKSQDDAHLRPLLDLIVGEMAQDLQPDFRAPGLEDIASFYVDPETGICVALYDAFDDSGQPWLVSSIAALVPAGQFATDWAGNRAVLDEVINKLNWHDSGCTWGNFKIPESLDSEAGGSVLLARIAGAAAPVGPRVSTWRTLTAKLIYEALRAHELRVKGEEGPASRHLDLLAIGSEGSVSPRAIQEAVDHFRDSLEPKLRDVVFTEQLPNGAGLTIPFRTRRTTVPLRLVLIANQDDETRGSSLDVYASMYTALPANEVTSWLESFNSTETGKEEENDDLWFDTTPWSLGSWVSFEAVGEEVRVIYRASIPNYMLALTDLEEIVKGGVREMWSTASKYRLHQEFQEAIGGLDGLIQQEQTKNRN